MEETPHEDGVEGTIEWHEARMARERPQARGGGPEEGTARKEKQGEESELDDEKKGDGKERGPRRGDTPERPPSLKGL